MVSAAADEVEILGLCRSGNLQGSPPKSLALTQRHRVAFFEFAFFWATVGLGLRPWGPFCKLSISSGGRGTPLDCWAEESPIGPHWIGRREGLKASWATGTNGGRREGVALLRLRARRRRGAGPPDVAGKRKLGTRGRRLRRNPAALER